MGPKQPIFPKENIALPFPGPPIEWRRNLSRAPNKVMGYEKIWMKFRYVKCADTNGEKANVGIIPYGYRK